MSGTFYVTTPIYYVNSNPHLGHLYTTTVADTLTRFHRQMGDEAFFLTGTDEHGINIERAAEKAGVPVQSHVDTYSSAFKEMIDAFALEPSRFIRTTFEAHKSGAKKLFETLKEKGFVYKDKYVGLYCGNCNQFYTEKESVEKDGKPSCPVHDVALDQLEEESYFFKLSAFEAPLLKYYEEHPDFIRPKARRNEIISFVSSGLQDLSISRTAVKWGIPVPGDEEHTLYVWLDALSNYITALGYGNQTYDGFETFWPANLQLVGKDILRFHTVFWPAFLMGAGLPLPKSVFAHGMWLSGGRKMSKTLGNVINIHTLRKHFSLDSIRYFCLREMAFGEDADFNYPALISRVNGDLAGGLGNLASRSLTLVQNNLDGAISPALDDDESAPVRETAARAKALFISRFKDLNFHRALEAAWELIGETDRYIANTKPWALAKAGELDALAQVMAVAAESLRFLAVLLQSIMPTACAALFAQLGLAGSPADINPESLKWGEGGARKMGALQGLFPRVNKGKLMAALVKAGEVAAPADKKAQKQQPKKAKVKVPKTPPAGYKPSEGADPVLDFGTFVRSDIRVGLVKSAEPHPNAEKLLRLEVDVGEPELRQLLAGVAEYYKPEDLLGKRVLVVANLAPRKIRGLVSHGMILAASLPDGRPFVIHPPEDSAPGSRAC